jgi:hypothetical protein
LLRIDAIGDAIPLFADIVGSALRVENREFLDGSNGYDAPLCGASFEPRPLAAPGPSR